MIWVALASSALFAWWNLWIFMAFNLRSADARFRRASRWFDRLKWLNPPLGAVVAMSWYVWLVGR